MKNLVLSILAALVLLNGCAASGPDGYEPWTAHGKEKYATPEPGTYLKPISFAVLKNMNRILDDPASFENTEEFVRKVFSPSLKELTDTVIRYNDRSVPVRIYYPNRESLEGDHPVILFFHGGGFILGSVEQYHMMVARLARVTGRIIVSVDYRLAPDYPFPAAVDDCYAAYLWLRAHAGAIGADRERITVMGDSAGGNLAAVVTLICRDLHQPQPENQVLIYPGVTFRDTLFPSMEYFAMESDMRYVLDETFLRKVKSEYLGGMKDDRHPYLSPLEARLTPDLPPALVITAECDPLRDGGKAYAEKLGKAGVPVRYREYSGMIHGFMSLHLVMGDATDAMKYIRDYLGEVQPSIN
ncbi:MAG: alpha/beta hydrolase [Bacteroidetes bacterium]|nr:MAG: alpha/beta hydrolase [Bacteroidota bacterium]